MKWVSIFKRVRLNIGDDVICRDNYYGVDIVCRVDRFYCRNREGHIYKFCRLSFQVGGVMKTINVLVKRCKKVNQ